MADKVNVCDQPMTEQKKLKVKRAPRALKKAKLEEIAVVATVSDSDEDSSLSSVIEDLHNHFNNVATNKDYDTDNSKDTTEKVEKPKRKQKKTKKEINTNTKKQDSLNAVKELLVDIDPIGCETVSKNEDERPNPRRRIFLKIRRL